jgi:hypothetical protein
VVIEVIKTLAKMVYSGMDREKTCSIVNGRDEEWIMYY